MTSTKFVATQSPTKVKVEPPKKAAKKPTRKRKAGSDDDDDVEVDTGLEEGSAWEGAGTVGV